MTVFVSRTRRTAAPFRPCSSAFRRNLLNVEDSWIPLVKALYRGKQIVDTPPPRLTPQ